jgi:hypothetical protein
MEPVIITLIVTNVVMVVQVFFNFLKHIKKSSCCGGQLEMQNAEDTPQEEPREMIEIEEKPKKKNLKKRA